MKQIRRWGIGIITTVMLIICAVTFLPTEAFAEVNETFTKENITYKVLTEPKGENNGTAEIVGTENANGLYAVDVAAIDYEGQRYNVTSVGEEALAYTHNLAIVNLPEVTTVGQKAFFGCGNRGWDDGLKTVNLPKAANVGQEAFAFCYNLKTVNLPKAEIIENWAFLECRKMENVCLSKAITSIGEAAFSSGLKNVFVAGITASTEVIPTIITDEVGTEGITYYKGTRTLPAQKEALTSAGSSVDLPVTFPIGGEVWTRDGENAEGVGTLPFILGKAGEYTTIENNQLSIGRDEETYVTVYALGCSEPLYIYTKDTPISISTPPIKTSYKDGETFDPKGMVLKVDCGTAEAKEVTEGYTIEPAGPLTLKDTQVTITYDGQTVKQDIQVSFDVDDLVYQLTDEAEKTAEIIAPLDANNLRSIDVAAIDYKGETYKVTSVAKEAFAYTPNLATVNLPEVTTVGEKAFYNCGIAMTPDTVGLETVNLPKATKVSEEAFAYCDNLKIVNLPNVEIVEDEAFGNCKKIEIVCLSKDITEISPYAFWDPGASRQVEENAIKTVFVAGITDSAEAIPAEITSYVGTAATTYYKGTRILPAQNEALSSAGSSIDLSTIFPISGDVWTEDGETPEEVVMFPYLLGKTGEFTTIENNQLSIGSDEKTYVTVYALGCSEPMFVHVLRSLTVSAQPTKKTYVQGEVFNPAGMRITANYGEAGTMDVTDDCTITPTGKLAATHKAVTITYRGVSITVPITVKAITKPATPTAKVSSTTYNSAKVSWSKASGATGYQVYRATSSKGSYTKVKTTTAASWTNTKLTTGKTYYYKVRAYKVQNGITVYGSFSKVIKAAPKTKAPSFKLTAGNDSAKVKWSKVSGASGYSIYRAASAKGKYKLVKNLGSKTTSYTNKKLKNKKTYYYKMRSYKTVNGKNVYSDYTSAKKVKTR